jgi:RNA 2',3'-cyclic 3'-phosphodiesterase
VSDDRARLFVALELPARVREALVDWRAEGVGVGCGGSPGEGLAAGGGLRLVDPENLHVTLCFLGSLPVAEIEGIGAACARAVAGTRDVVRGSLSFGDLVWLPARRPRVVAVRLDDRTGRLAALHASISRALHSGGWYVPEGRPFLAHVTVARAGRRGHIRRVEIPAPPRSQFALGDAGVTLYRSRLGPGGARYEVVRRIPLGGRAGGEADRGLGRRVLDCRE